MFFVISKSKLQIRLKDNNLKAVLHIHLTILEPCFKQVFSNKLQLYSSTKNFANCAINILQLCFVFFIFLSTFFLQMAYLKTFNLIK